MPIRWTSLVLMGLAALLYGFGFRWVSSYGVAAVIGLAIMIVVGALLTLAVLDSASKHFDTVLTATLIGLVFASTALLDIADVPTWSPVRLLVFGLMVLVTYLLSYQLLRRQRKR